MKKIGTCLHYLFIRKNKSLHFNFNGILGIPIIYILFPILFIRHAMSK